MDGAAVECLTRNPPNSHLRVKFAISPAPTQLSIMWIALVLLSFLLASPIVPNKGAPGN